jgi:hypothetical protein
VFFLAKYPEGFVVQLSLDVRGVRLDTRGLHYLLKVFERTLLGKELGKLLVFATFKEGLKNLGSFGNVPIDYILILCIDTRQ